MNLPSADLEQVGALPSDARSDGWMTLLQTTLAVAGVAKSPVISVAKELNAKLDGAEVWQPDP